MPIIDSQVHVYEANTRKRPWHSEPNWPGHVTGDEMVAAMDRVGVDGRGVRLLNHNYLWTILKRWCAVVLSMRSISYLQMASPTMPVLTPEI